MAEAMDSITAFSQPWKSSDLVLVVQGRKFHVHRDVLTVCSPVFEAMLCSNFKEKSALEIALPEKEADEIEKLLNAIYPDRKLSITTQNCFVLLPLSYEYQIDVLKTRCEKFFRRWCNGSGQMSNDEAIKVLILSQMHPMDDEIVKGCIERFATQENTTWKRLKNNSLFSEVEPSNVQRILEVRVNFLEQEVKQRDAMLRVYRPR